VYAKEVAGYPSVFAHGMLTMAMTGRMLTDYVGDGRLVRFGGRFMAQVWPGATLTATAKVIGLSDEHGEPCVELEVTTSDDQGNEVFRGTAVARIDD
jgi:acyl dehydratase